MTKALALLNPPIQVLTKAPLKKRREVAWYAEMGMPMQGTTTHVVKRVIKVRREMK